MSADDEGFTEQQNIANQMDDRVSKKQSEIADAMDEISDDIIDYLMKIQVH